MAALPPLPEGPWGVNPDAAAAALAGRRVALAQRETALQRWAAALGLEAAQAAAAAANLAAAQQQVCSPGFASWLCCCKRPLLEQAAQADAVAANLAATQQQVQGPSIACMNRRPLNCRRLAVGHAVHNRKLLSSFYLGSMVVLQLGPPGSCLYPPSGSE